MGHSVVGQSFCDAGLVDAHKPARALFVFIGEGEQPDSFVFPIDEMGRLQDETDPNRLRFHFESQTVEFTHRKGQEFENTFWELCNAPTQLRGSQASRQRRTLSRLDGVVSFLRVLVSRSLPSGRCAAGDGG